MKIKVLFFALFLFWFISVHGQSAPCNECVYLDIFKRCITFTKLKDTLNIELDNSTYLRVYVEACKGDLYFERRTIKDSSVLVRGYYKSTGKVLKKNSRVADWSKDPTGATFTSIVSFYYMPKRYGKWLFLSSDGKVYKSFNYGR